MQPGEPGPALYDGWGWEVLKGAKGVVWNAPVSMIEADLYRTFLPGYYVMDVGDAVGNAIMDPSGTATAVVANVRQKIESGSEGQGELVGYLAIGYVTGRVAEGGVPRAAKPARTG